MHRFGTFFFGGVLVASASFLQAEQVTLEPGTALRIVLDRRCRIHRGALLHGHLSEPVYRIDHLVIPAGTLVSGVIRTTHAGPRSERVRRLLAADFTPPKVPDAVFTSLILPAQGNKPERVLQLDAPAVQTDASVLTLGTKKQKRSIKSQISSAVKENAHDAFAMIKRHQIGEIVERWAVGQLPYHPEILWSDARFNADLSTPTVLPDQADPVLPTEDLKGRLPQGVLHARLISPLTSELTRRGDPVVAVVTQPLLSPDHERLLVPEGARLRGAVVQTKAARSFGRNGDLRFVFRSLDLTAGNGAVQAKEIHGRLSAAGTVPGQNVTIDEEGQARANDGPAKYAEPLLLGVLAAAGGPDEKHPGTAAPGAAAYSSNGLGVIARIVSLSSGNANVTQGFAYYSLAKSIYFRFIAKGHETTFSRDTEIEVTLSDR